MSNGNEDQFEQMLEMLAKILGEDDATRLRDELASHGITADSMDNLSLSGLTPDGAFGMVPGMGPMMFGQNLFKQSDGPVNWEIAMEVARAHVTRKGDPSLTAAEAARYRTALQVAELWLDSVTTLQPPSAKPEAWSRAKWLDATRPTWQQVCEPIAVQASKEIGNAMRGAMESAGMDQQLPPQLAQMLGTDPASKLSEIMDRMGATVFGMQMGQALGTLATDALGFTSIGLPMVGDPHLALVGSAVSEFGDGLEVDTDQVIAFVAVREAAHARLFAAVPWLRHRVLDLVRDYAQNIEIDVDAIEQAAREADPGNPESLQQALQGGMFVPTLSEKQQQALDRLGTALAVIEGWVEEVTLRATLPHLSSAVALDEMMRRRRASGSPAEKLFSKLLGLQLAPKRSREASKLWSLATDRWGMERRDAMWSHPSQLPTEAELDDPHAAIETRESVTSDSMDDELARMLDGTLDWAEGLSPDTDSEGDAKASGD